MTLNHSLAVLCGAAAALASPCWNASVHADDLGQSTASGSIRTERVEPLSSAQVAAEVDRLVQKELDSAGVTPAALTLDEDFLRRISFDIAGTLPSPREVTLFGLDTSPEKRTAAIDRLLASDAYAETWARYWRDVMFTRATNQRVGFVNEAFVAWLTDAFRENRPWDAITTDLLTATGDVRDNGDTALMFIHEGSPEEIAGEVSRIFLGIQVQCANCHDHPWDRWKRDQFHELAAFFPRVSVRPIQEDGMLRSYEVVSFNRNNDPDQRRRMLMENADRIFRFADRNRDNRLTKDEVQQTMLERPFDLLLQRGDTNKDGGLSLAELKAADLSMPDMPGRGRAEHFMADLNDPSSPGEQIDPRFFVTGFTPETGLEDLERRELLASIVTNTNNDWFARSFVNRMWAEFTGQGFYTPIDDMGPDRSAIYPSVLELLARQFAANHYNIQWLVKTIALSNVYQRQIGSAESGVVDVPFAAATPTRLRADHIYNAIQQVVGAPAGMGGRPGRGMMMMAPAGMYGRSRDPRDQFATLFGFDPSTPQADITGQVPQALFMMNSPLLAGQIDARGFTRLAALLRRYSDNDAAVAELYLLVLAREPSDSEQQIFADYLAQTGSREEAFEDLMWSLLNSSEFITKR